MWNLSKNLLIGSALFLCVSVRVHVLLCVNQALCMVEVVGMVKWCNLLCENKDYIFFPRIMGSKCWISLIEFHASSIGSWWSQF